MRLSTPFQGEAIIQKYYLTLAKIKKLILLTHIWWGPLGIMLPKHRRDLLAALHYCGFTSQAAFMRRWKLALVSARRPSADLWQLSPRWPNDQSSHSRGDCRCQPRLPHHCQCFLGHWPGQSPPDTDCKAIHPGKSTGTKLLSTSQKLQFKRCY